MCDQNLRNSEDIRLKAKEAIEELLPTKSSERYKKEFEIFNEWRAANDVQKVDEDVVLAYLVDLSKKYSSASLWSKYSMIKSMLLVQENTDVSCFGKVKAFLKKKSVGYEAKQAKTLTREELNRFLKEAPDREHLLTKVAAMIGVAGGCRREELHEMSLKDIEETGSQLVIVLPKTKTNQKRVFTVLNESDGIHCLELFRKYVNLRPKNVQHNHLFVGYRNGHCINQRVGIHTFGGMPKTIATFLGLESPKSYTGHTFRRTGATLLANAGANALVMKRFGGWKSNSIAEKYVEQSIEEKKKIARMIQGGESFVDVLNQQENSENCVMNNSNTSICTETSINMAGDNSKFLDQIRSVNVNKNSNCTININFSVN